jgi:hypothetical protein
MKITVNWRRVFRSYLKFLSWYLPIGLVPIAFIVGLEFYDLGWSRGWQHFFDTFPILMELIAFKLKFYGSLAAIVLVITAIGDLIGAYFGQLWPVPGRTDETAVRPVESAGRGLRDHGSLPSKTVRALPSS